MVCAASPRGLLFIFSCFWNIFFFLMVKKKKNIYVHSHTPRYKPKVKLHITPPGSNTVFGVFEMGTAASAHDVLLRSSCYWHMIFI